MSDEENKPAEEEKADTPVAAEEKAPVAAEAPAEKKEEAPETKEDAKSPEGEGEESKQPEKKKDIFAEIMGEESMEALKVHKAKKNKNVTKGIVHVKATFNNTVVTVTDEMGNAIGWSSAGKLGFKGSRKSTAYAAQVVSQDACRQAMSHGLKEAEVRVKGPGAGRESAVRAIQTLGIDISALQDVTPIPHNGCRPKKARRV
jgi:small subunit ribosomal protein S11